MIEPKLDRWGQSCSDLKRMATSSSHPRTRERFSALAKIASGISITKVAADLKKHRKSLVAWVKIYNERGPSALIYRHSGAPLFEAKESGHEERDVGTSLPLPLREPLLDSLQSAFLGRLALYAGHPYVITIVNPENGSPSSLLTSQHPLRSIEIFWDDDLSYSFVSSLGAEEEIDPDTRRNIPLGYIPPLLATNLTDLRRRALLNTMKKS